LMQYQAGY